jgi:hypothetical protein
VLLADERRVQRPVHAVQLAVPASGSVRSATAASSPIESQDPNTPVAMPAAKAAPSPVSKALMSAG